jgi:hypothetical protein
MAARIVAAMAGSGEAMAASQRDRAGDGYVDGSNVIIEFRWTNEPAHLPRLAVEFVSKNTAMEIVRRGAAANMSRSSLAHTVSRTCGRT